MNEKTIDQAVGFYFKFGTDSRGNHFVTDARDQTDVFCLPEELADAVVLAQNNFLAELCILLKNYNPN